MSINLLKTRVSDAVHIPKDVILGVPLVKIVGREEAYIENYRGITEYTGCHIRIQTKIGCISLCGRDLEIEYYTNDEMKVIGIIESLEYCQEG